MCCCRVLFCDAPICAWKVRVYSSRFAVVSPPINSVASSSSARFCALFFLSLSLSRFVQFQLVVVAHSIWMFLLLRNRIAQMEISFATINNNNNVRHCARTHTNVHHTCTRYMWYRIQFQSELNKVNSVKTPLVAIQQRTCARKSGRERARAHSIDRECCLFIRLICATFVAV